MPLPLLAGVALKLGGTAAAYVLGHLIVQKYMASPQTKEAAAREAAHHLQQLPPKLLEALIEAIETK